MKCEKSDPNVLSVNSVTIRPDLLSADTVSKHFRIACWEGLLQEQDMLFVYLANHLLDLFIPIEKPGELGIGGFVHRVVTRDPGIALVVLRQN